MEGGAGGICTKAGGGGGGGHYPPHPPQLSMGNITGVKKDRLFRDTDGWRYQGPAVHSSYPIASDAPHRQLVATGADSCRIHPLLLHNAHCRHIIWLPGAGKEGRM